MALWVRYVATFVAGDGRVIDRSAADRSTSEGQAYALFFALVADDRALFDRLLHWTEQNLAQGDLSRQLPAWHWGKRRDGGWGVIDANSASDADLWLAYALLEAGRLWSQPRYGELARGVLGNVAAREIAQVAGAGTVLLPGPSGFALDGGYRVNPSYEPPQVLRRLAQLPGPWRALAESAARRLQAFASGGAVPDWAVVRPGRPLSEDPVHGRTGSYDAIRAYLWVGMSPERDARLDGIAAGLCARCRAPAGSPSASTPAACAARARRRRASMPRCFPSRLPPRAQIWRGTWRRRSATASRRPACLLRPEPRPVRARLPRVALPLREDGALAPAWETRCFGRAR